MQHGYPEKITYSEMVKVVLSKEKGWRNKSVKGVPFGCIENWWVILFLVGAHYICLSYKYITNICICNWQHIQSTFFRLAIHPHLSLSIHKV